MELKNQKNISIDWSKFFDHIFCIHYSGYRDRLQRILNTTRDVGIQMDPNFFTIIYGIDTPYYSINKHNYIFDSTDDRQNQAMFGCSYNHYQAYKISSLSHFKRILVIEDDIIFLKNKDTIKDMLENMPNDSDIVVFDKFMTRIFGLNYDIDFFINNNCDMYVNFSNTNLRIMSTSCYYMNDKAIEEAIKIHEDSIFGQHRHRFVNSDHIWNYGRLNNLNKYYAVKNMAIQVPFSDRISYNYNKFYDVDLIKMEDYI